MGEWHYQCKQTNTFLSPLFLLKIRYTKPVPNLSTFGHRSDRVTNWRTLWSQICTVSQIGPKSPIMCWNDNYSVTYILADLPYKTEMTLIASARISIVSLIAKFMGPKWGPSGANRTQMCPMLALWILLSGITADVVQLNQHWFG